MHMDPAWLPAFDRARPLAPDALMGLALDVALESARHDGGPFGAVVADAQGRVVDVGWNRVLATKDSTAHAEIVALRRAQARLATHALTGCALYTSCAPCVQCFGAIYWSGVARVYAAAHRDDAEALGFDEGPPLDALWEHARDAKGISYVPDFHRDERAMRPFEAYQRRGGAKY